MGIVLKEGIEVEVIKKMERSSQWNLAFSTSNSVSFVH